MPDRKREMGTWKQRVKPSVCESEVSALKTSEYSTWWQWVPKHYQPLHLAFHFIPQLFHLKQFHVSQARRGALAEADTPAFFSDESQIPWNLFMLWAIDWLICFTCHLQFIISAASGRTYRYLWTASFPAFIKWLMHPVWTAPPSQLAHLLVAVEKVCAGGVVFAGLW